MIRPLLAAWLLLHTACATERTPPGGAADGDLALRNVNVVDVERGSVVPAQTVLIRGNRIVAIAPASEVRTTAGTRILDGTGKYVMPGLWDMHTHLTNPDADSLVMLPLYVANGVTGIRDMWSDPPGTFADSAAGLTMLENAQNLRAAVRAGRLIGPRILLASGPLDGPFGPDGYLNVVRTPEDARAVVARAAANGVDVIGMYRWISPDAYAAAAAAARDAGLPVVGLAPVAATFAEMAAAGQRTRDGHVEWEIACSTTGDSLRSELRAAARRDALPAADSLRSNATLHLATRAGLRETFDAARCARVAREVAGTPVWQTPRFVYGQPVSSEGRNAAAGAVFLTPAEREAWEQKVRQVRRDSAGVVSALAAREREIFRILHHAGIPLLVGTESYFGSPGTGGFSVHDELVELVGIGLTPAEALRAGTLHPARAMEMTDSLGSIAVGQLADLVLLDANPLEDIRNSTHIHAVVLNGRLLDRAALDEIRERARTAP